jgi:hypothetical protein
MMAASMEARFACEECGRAYRWKPELAGRELKCACGSVITAPAERPDVDGDLYNFADDAPATKPAAPRVPTTPAKVGEGVVAPAAVRAADAGRTIEYQRPTTPGNPTDIERLFPDRVKDLYMPLALIAAGTLVHVIYAVFQVRGGGYRLPVAMMQLGWHVVVQTGLMLVALLIAAKFRGIQFGPLPTTIIKLCAVTLTPGAVAIIAIPLAFIVPVLGGIVILLVEFCAYFAILGALFDLDQSDTWYCICVIFIVNVTVYFVQFKFW